MIKIFNTFLFISLSVLLPAQSIDGVYDYPVKPGTKEWYELKTEEERFAILQIPDDLLKSMSTENLIITCMNFPLFGDYTAYNNPQQGMEYIIDNFNGLQELLNRKDAPSGLLALYYETDTVEMFMANPKISKKYWFIRQSYFELILAQDLIVDQMSLDNCYNLLLEARKRLNYKIDNKQKYSAFSFRPTLLIMGKMLDRLDYTDIKSEKDQNVEMEQFMKDCSLMTPEVINSLIAISDNYIKIKK